MANKQQAQKKQRHKTKGEYARSLRERLGWSQEKAAESWDISVRTIREVESGRGATAKILQIIADKFQIPWHNLLTDKVRARLFDAHLVSPVSNSVLPDALSKEVDKYESDGLLKAIRMRGELVVGAFRYPPMIDFAQSETGWSAIGFYADMIHHVATANGLRIRYVPMRSDMILSSISERKVDCIPCTFSTMQRREVGDIIAVLHRVRLNGIVPKRKSKVTRHEDLLKPNVRILVAKGEIGWEYANRYLGLKNDLHRRFLVSEYDVIADLMDPVKSGTIDIALADAMSCLQYHHRNKREVSRIFQTDPLDIYDVGTLIPKKQKSFGEWLLSGFESARSTPPIKAIEHAIIAKYEHVFSVANVEQDNT